MPDPEDELIEAMNALSRQMRALRRLYRTERLKSEIDIWLDTGFGMDELMLYEDEDGRCWIQPMFTDGLSADEAMELMDDDDDLEIL